MTNLANVVRQLKKERLQAQRRIEQLDGALQALSGVGVVSATTAGHGRTKASSAKRRPMSAAARKRMAAAQRARWAKWRSARPSE